MIELEWPWILALLPLPWLLRRLLPAASRIRQAALRVPSLGDFRAADASGRSQSTRAGALWLALLAWLLLVAAAARPQWHGDLVELPVSGRDLMLAVDISGSMEMADFRLGKRLVNRLTATKAVAAEFIERRAGDRVGLVLFGRRAYVQTPLTFDRETVNTLLQEAQVGFAGKETAIGDAIGLGLKHLRARPAQSRVLVLLTDGANTAGSIDPLKAAGLAAEEGLKIYTIGIGSDRASLGFQRGSRSFLGGSQLDEDTLQVIAQVTGGRYFRARDTRELERIYAELDALEPVEHQMAGFRPRRALFFWPLGMSLGLGLAALASALRVGPGVYA